MGLQRQVQLHHPDMGRSRFGPFNTGSFDGYEVLSGGGRNGLHGKKPRRMLGTRIIFGAFHAQR